ncbi:MAG: hypothetical protein JNM10_19740 [Planctomycetia bacterium]|nr:hypothetical protein [Planctomycetia bacterium]
MSIGRWSRGVGTQADTFAGPCAGRVARRIARGLACAIAGVLVVAGVPARAEPPHAPVGGAPAAAAPEVPELPGPFAPLEVQLAVSDLVVEGTVGDATTSPVHGVGFDVRRTVAGTPVGARLVVAVPDEEASLRHADLAGPRGTALLLLLQRARPTDAAFTLVTSFDLARVEAAGVALDGRPGAAADHVEGVAFFARLAGDRDAPARDAARWAEGLRGGNAFVQQNLLLRVDGYAALGLSTGAVGPRALAARATAAPDLLRAVVDAARGEPGPHPWALGPAYRSLRALAPDAASAAEAALATGLASRDGAVLAPALRAAARLGLVGAVERAWALVGDPAIDDALRATALSALGEAALASAPQRAALRARADLTALLRKALGRPALRAAALEALEAIHRDGRVTITARNEALWIGGWEPARPASPR